MNQPIHILTGPVQSGKTTLLRQWVTQQKNVAGILTPVIDDNRFFFNIENGISFPMNATDDETDILSVGRFRFSAYAFARASTILMNAVNNKDHSYIIIDEIGPLELKQHKGFFLALQFVLEHAGQTNILLVVRENCLEDIKTLIGDREVEISGTGNILKRLGG